MEEQATPIDRTGECVLFSTHKFGNSIAEIAAIVALVCRLLVSTTAYSTRPVKRSPSVEHPLDQSSFDNRSVCHDMISLGPSCVHDPPRVHLADVLADYDNWRVNADDSRCLLVARVRPLSSMIWAQSPRSGCSGPILETPRSLFDRATTLLGRQRSSPVCRYGTVVVALSSHRSFRREVGPLVGR